MTDLTLAHAIAIALDADWDHTAEDAVSFVFRRFPGATVDDVWNAAQLLDPDVVAQMRQPPVRH